MNTIGIALSGGGARGIAHLGVLHGLNEMGIYPNTISAVSSGAIIGALYAAGYSPKEILKMVKEHASSSIAAMILFPGGLFSPSGLRQILTAAIAKDTFEGLYMPLFVTATDISAGTPVTFSTGPLFDVLIGSSSIPVLFNPQKHGKQFLVDGGVTNNLPVECIRNQCSKIIGSNVNKLFEVTGRNLDRLQVFDRCFHLAISNTVLSNAKLCDVFVEPPLGGYSMFETKHADLLFKIGYRAITEQRSLFLSWTNDA